MKWNIISDSSCDLMPFENEELQVRYDAIPFIIRAGEKEFVDDPDLDTIELLDALDKVKGPSHTACPSPQNFYEAFKKEGNVICITISSELSGSYNSACIARNMVLEEEPDKNIAVINSRAAGSTQTLMVEEAIECIRKEMTHEDIVHHLMHMVGELPIIFALCSFNNLVKNGRMSAITGFIAGKLGFWGIGIASPQGTIEIKGKTRGAKKALAAIIADMAERRVPKHKVVIDHCDNLEMAEALRDAIVKTWGLENVEIHPTRGLCSFYAERHGLIVTYY